MDDYNTKQIMINIWDDYFDDDDVPDGVIQETYIFVEDDAFTQDFEKECLEFLLPFINASGDYDGATFHVGLWDSKTDPETAAAPQYLQWRIIARNFTQANRELLLERLQGLKLAYQGLPLDIYSES